LETDHFNTESGFDFLTVNNERFSGFDGPGTMEFAPGTHVNISWRSDENVNAVGWKICFVLIVPNGTASPTAAPTFFPTFAPTVVPTVVPTFAPTGTVLPTGIPPNFCRFASSGDPTDSRIGCFTSGNFPSNYKDSEECIIEGPVPPGGLKLETDHFNTQSGFDFLTVNDERFSGTDGPGTMEFALGTNVNMSWRSDGSVTSSGWKICFGNGTERNSLAHCCPCGHIRAHCGPYSDSYRCTERDGATCTSSANFVSFRSQASQDQGLVLQAQISLPIMATTMSVSWTSLDSMGSG